MIAQPVTAQIIRATRFLSKRYIIPIVKNIDHEFHLGTISTMTHGLSGVSHCQDAGTTTRQCSCVPISAKSAWTHRPLETVAY